jgi:hypothetical protein
LVVNSRFLPIRFAPADASILLRNDRCVGNNGRVSALQLHVSWRESDVELGGADFSIGEAIRVTYIRVSITV